MKKTPYQQLVGYLLYVAISTQTDIAFGAQQLMQYLDSYATIHWHAAICLVQYLKGTQNLQLYLGSSESDIRLTDYTNSDWASCPDT